MNYMLLPLRRYGEFRGRSRRKEYWMFILFQFLLYVGLVGLMALFGGGLVALTDPTAVAAAGVGAGIIGLLYLVVVLGLIIPSIAVGVRRLHDTDRTGWWLLAPAVPYLLMLAAIAVIVGAPDTAVAGGLFIGLMSLIAFGLGITVFVFMLLDGTRGPNRFGPDPKQSAEHLGDVFA